MDFETDPETGGVLIPLSSTKYPNLVTLVDAGDVDAVCAIRWRVSKGIRSKTLYARGDQDGRGVMIHRLILGLNDPSQYVDHINRNGLDNRRVNLRVVTAQQNTFNTTARRGSTSAFKGVQWDPANRNWRAQIRKNRRNISLGRFQDEEAAARAYDEKARELFGEFAVLNFPEAAS